MKILTQVVPVHLRPIGSPIINSSIMTKRPRIPDASVIKPPSQPKSINGVVLRLIKLSIARWKSLEVL